MKSVMLKLWLSNINTINFIQEFRETAYEFWIEFAYEKMSRK